MEAYASGHGLGNNNDQESGSSSESEPQPEGPVDETGGRFVPIEPEKNGEDIPMSPAMRALSVDVSFKLFQKLMALSVTIPTLGHYWTKQENA